MADVVNRITKQHLVSVNTPDFPTVDWIHNPDLSAVRGFDSKYWVITGDVVSLMTPAQRATVDSQEVEAVRDHTANGIDQVEALIRALSLVLLDEINLLRDRVDPPLAARTIAQVKTAIRNKLGT